VHQALTRHTKHIGHVYPPQLVEVLNAGVWHRGKLEAGRRDGDHWDAYVRYTVATGMQHLGWVTADLVRPV
jgi:hypothetical protein